MAGKTRDYDCTQDNFSKTEDEVKYKVSFVIEWVDAARLGN